MLRLRPSQSASTDESAAPSTQPARKLATTLPSVAALLSASKPSPVAVPNCRMKEGIFNTVSTIPMS